MTDGTGKGLRAGAAAVEITPPPGTHLAGDGAGIHRPACTVLDPLFASAVVVEDGARRLCLLSLDLLCVTREHTDRIRAEAARRFGLEPEAVLVHALQNHSAPSLGRMMFDPDFPLDAPGDREYAGGAERAYCAWAEERAVEAVGRACAALRPARAGWGRGVLEGLAFNRRAILDDGSVGMPWFYKQEQLPRGPTRFRCLEGPFDPEVGVLALRGDDGRFIALLGFFACHPVNVYATDKRAVSGDWPGAWAAAMREDHPGCVPLVLNGCCGNLNPWPAFTPDFVPDHRRMGGKLNAMTRRIVEDLDFGGPALADCRVFTVGLDYREIPAARLAGVEAILRESPALKWDAARGEVDVRWFLAASTRSVACCKARWPVFPYEVQVFRIGDAVVAGLPGEPFVEGQLALKVGAPVPFLQTAHMCNQYAGYLPTRAAAARGGHEANAECTYWAKFAPDAWERVEAAVRRAVSDMTGRDWNNLG